MVSGNHIVVIVWTVFKQQSLDLVGSPKQARAVLVVLVLRHILNQFLQVVMAGRLEGRTTPIQPNWGTTERTSVSRRSDHAWSDRRSEPGLISGECCCR